MWIQETLLTAAKGYARLVKAEGVGKGRINRSAKTGRIKRLARKASKSNWFKSDPKYGDSQEDRKNATPGNTTMRRQKSKEKKIESILFIPNTPESTLKKEVQRME